jgi:hypothetical protein
MPLPMGFMQSIKINAKIRVSGFMFFVKPVVKSEHPLAGWRNIMCYNTLSTYNTEFLRGF